MQMKRAQGKTLRYVTMLPDGYDEQKSYPTVVMLHGFGANMQDLAPLGEVLNPAYLYLCPNAPVQMQISPWQLGYGWTPPRDLNAPEFTQQAEALLAGFFDETFAQYKVKPGNVVLMGFSQGGGMTFRCGLPRPEIFPGIAALCAVVPDEAEMRAKLPAQRTQKVFVAYGEQDQLIPPERAHAAKKFLEGAGYPLRFKGYRMGHEISPEVIADLRTWLGEVLGNEIAGR